MTTTTTIIYLAANVVELVIVYLFVRRAFGRMVRGWR